MFAEEYLNEVKEIADLLDQSVIEDMMKILHMCRPTGRLFILGVGGSAASASHSVNDFRKICNIEAYAPTDNVAELTARTNDEGWDTVFIEWLRVSNLKEQDVLLILSVGGGSSRASVNLKHAIDYAKRRHAKIIGIVGKESGYTQTNADACLIIPEVNKNRITPHTESFHSVITHLLVSHPLLQREPTRWEFLDNE